MVNINNCRVDLTGLYRLKHAHWCRSEVTSLLKTVALMRNHLKAVPKDIATPMEPLAALASLQQNLSALDELYQTSKSRCDPALIEHSIQSQLKETRHATPYPDFLDTTAPAATLNAPPTASAESRLTALGVQWDSCMHVGLLWVSPGVSPHMVCAVTQKRVMELDLDGDGTFSNTQLFFVDDATGSYPLRIGEAYAPPEARMFSQTGSYICVEVLPMIIDLNVYLPLVCL